MLSKCRFALAAGLSLLVFALSPVVGFGQDDGESEVRPGIVASYKGADGVDHVRLEESASLTATGTPDPRLPPGKFSVRWQGMLLAQAEGEYRLHVFVAGEVRVSLLGRVILEGGGSADTASHGDALSKVSSSASGGGRWVVSQPVELDYGHHPLVVEYQQTGEAPRLGLYWSGPNFSLEPIAPRFLFHDPSSTPDGKFDRGRQLSRALRCAACHDIPGEAGRLAAPSLTRLAGNVSSEWLTAWLRDSHGNEGAHEAPSVEQRSRRMPYFDLSVDDAAAVSAFLLHRPRPSEEAGKNKAKPTKGEPEEGRKLFATLGCLACHQVDGVGSEGLFGGGDLAGIAQKRPAEFFARWLTDPASVNADHRMPVFELADQETSDLAAYLATLGGRDQIAKASDEMQPPNVRLVEPGAKLFAQHRCSACHELDDRRRGDEVSERIRLGAEFHDGCLAGPDANKPRPGYRLGHDDRAALRMYVAAMNMAKKPRTHGHLDAPMLLAERNCTACHARGLSQGIAVHLPELIEQHPKLSTLMAGMSPPPLFDVGDKLHDKSLVEAITRSGSSRRPWLSIRMPRFRLSEKETGAIVDYFVGTDRIPERPVEPPNEPDESALHLAGSRLVTADGFGCTSCHQIGNQLPQGVALAAHGPDLSLLGSRIRRPWYDRWVRNPARIVPRMEMPSVQLAVGGVLNDHLDHQLAAVWHVLNREGFNPPAAGALRTVRASGVPERGELASVLTDVLEVGDRKLIKPLVIGLANRHNVLFDLESSALAGWWIGDTARQRTRGKTWYWETAGNPVVPIRRASSELVLMRGEERSEPLLNGQFPTEFDVIEHVTGGLRFEQRLRFAAEQGTEPYVIRISQTYEAIYGSNQSGESGFRRRLVFNGLPKREKFELRVSLGVNAKLSRDRRELAHQTTGGDRVRVVLPQDMRLHKEGGEVWLPVTAGDDKELALELEYLTDLPIDRFEQVDTAFAKPATPLTVVPGYEAVRLSLPESVMPTGLAWRNDGTLAVSSLNGLVFLLRDTNGDGLEDKAIRFSDELAAPYGVAAHGDAIDVINKYALLRLFDKDGDGRAERTETVASGWGHTADYHDWAVGLIKDGRGGYFVALPCQQDDRTSAAAYLRGTAVRLSPREPTAENPRRYSLEKFCAGLRFPMGLAKNHDGALFASDNQGNYNPFNELNHLVEGGHYGFINKLESKAGLQPARRDDPAIDIPHPWTRSVNGICFLDAPIAGTQAHIKDFFGPFQGHLIACEYDTRRLVRMSLEQVDGVWQGAVYPFSIEPDAVENALEGPVVCAVAPDGGLYVGNMRDSGWGAGRNTGSIVRLRPERPLPTGIAEVRAASGGFEVHFTAPIDHRRARDVNNYVLSSYRRTVTPAYGGPDEDRRTETIRDVAVSEDGRVAKLSLAELREGFVYEFHLKNMVTAGKLFHPAEAHYTLRRGPR